MHKIINFTHFLKIVKLLEQAIVISSVIQEIFLPLNIFTLVRYKRVDDTIHTYSHLLSTSLTT